MQDRGEFSSRFGFVMAAAGASVGLGNIWRFPYLATKYGGGAFLLMYIIFVITLGFTIMIAEIGIGRKTRLSPICAYEKLNKKYSFIGIIVAIISFLVISYYSVIGGWVIKYFVTYVSGGYLADDTFFEQFISQPAEQVMWQTLFILMTVFIVWKGVEKGIEKVNKILMPILILLSVAVAVYSITLPGALEGVKYFILPDFSNFSVNGVLAALGQMFYSLSLSMGVMVTFGSYLNKKTDIEKAVKRIEFFDVSISVLAGFMVIPAVFAFSGGNQDALNAGPGLMFVTLPKVFQTMGLNRVIGSAFFLLVFFAALTSAISIAEAAVQTFCDRFHISRKKSTIITALLTFVLGIPSSLGYGIWDGIKLLGMTILDFVDFLTNAVMMPVGALLTSVFVGWVIGVKPISDEIKLSSAFRRQKMFKVIIKYVAPVIIAFILISSILDTFGWITL